MSAICTIAWNSAGLAPHMASFLFKSVQIESGKTVQLQALHAGMLLRDYPQNAKLIQGTPEDPPSQKGARAKALIHAEKEREDQWPSDPTRVLSSFRALPEAIRNEKDDGEACKLLESGKYEAHLLDIALWAVLSGRKDLADACVQRQEALYLSRK